MATCTVKFWRNHNLDGGAEYAVYHTTVRAGTGMTQLTTWKPLWPVIEDKIGRGLGNRGYGLRGTTGFQGVVTGEGRGIGYRGRGHRGYSERVVRETITDLANGLHVFEVRLRDKAKNESVGLTGLQTIWLCDPPATPKRAQLTAQTPTQITFEWSG